MNGPARIEYGASRQASKAIVLLNNFDYRHGDPVAVERGWTRIGTPVGVDLEGRRVEFRRHANYEVVQPLAMAGFMRAASVTDCYFDVSDGESDTQVLEFATDIAALSTIAAGAGLSVAMVDLVDGAGTVVRRVVPQPVTARYSRNDKIIDDIYLPEYFRATFSSFLAMARTHAPWRKLVSHCRIARGPTVP